MKLPSYILFFYEGIVLLYVLTKNFVVCVPVHFLFFSLLLIFTSLVAPC